jgi:hypothetical protein
LRDLLAAGKWKEADRETVKAIKQIKNPSEKPDVFNISFKQIPDPDLKKIDHLWVKYSNGRFGLSIQKEIYQRLVQPSEINKKRLQRFGNEIGWYENGKWKNYNQLNFSGDAPYGHFPAALWFNQEDWETIVYNIILCGLFLLFFLFLLSGVWIVAFIDFAIFITFSPFYASRIDSKGFRINQSNILKNLQFLTSLQITSSQTLASASQTSPSPSTATSGSQVELRSAVGYDYTRLRDLLAKQKWKEADEETAKAMLKVAGRDEFLEIEDIRFFPCEDLRTIDRLWVKSSNGKFGFSVQKEIYIKLGGTEEFDGLIWEKFGDTVGWRRKRETFKIPIILSVTYPEWVKWYELDFDLDNSPRGHLPVLLLCIKGNHMNDGELPVVVWSSLAKRLVGCCTPLLWKPGG